MSTIAVSTPRGFSFKMIRELSKSGIVALVLISVLGGYLAGHPFEQSLDLIKLSSTLIAILLLASGSSALNQWQESRLDARMDRTAQRPIPSGRISKNAALLFSVVTIVTGALFLFFINPSVGLLGLSAVIFYNGFYTLWWKPKMAFAAVPGAVPGALPILMGYAAACGSVWTPGGLYLFALLFFWQMPHFWVLALKYRNDYAQGGFPTLPVAMGEFITIRHIVLWCLAYVAIALGAPIFIRVGSVALVSNVLMSAVLIYQLVGFVKKPEGKAWLKFFLWVNFSLIIYIGSIVADLWSVYLIHFLTR